MATAPIRPTISTRPVIRLSALLLLWALSGALAGGVVVTLDASPVAPRAGEAFAVGFTVRSMHDGSPQATLVPAVTATHAVTAETVTAAARPDGTAGHYRVVLVLPTAGEWRWWIQPLGAEAHGYPPSVLVPLTVHDAAARAGTPAPAGPTDAPAGFADAAGWGGALFLDKGCADCHRNRRAAADGPIATGPDLTDYRGDAGFLRRWLADPQAVRPGTTMPDLGIADGEIEALIAFLNAPR